MNPYYGRPGFKTAREAFVQAIKMSYRWGDPYRIWHDKDGWYAFSERVKGTGKNIGITYQIRNGRQASDPIIRVKLFFKGQS